MCVRHIFLFRQKTAYERRISDWSSYVCSSDLTTIAVTGTNGKTSTVEMTRQLWRMAGHHAASIGTLGVATADDSVSTGLTTPDIVTFLSNVAGLAREGVTQIGRASCRERVCQDV